MPWHLSLSDPRKVYDERHGDVAVCQTAQQAAIIVEAVNRMRDSGGAPRTIRLQEPEPAPSPGTLEIFHDDDCCKKHLMRAQRASLTEWECPKCGCEWRWEMRGEVKYWYPVAAIAIFPARR